MHFAEHIARGTRSARCCCSRCCCSACTFRVCLVIFILLFVPSFSRFYFRIPAQRLAGQVALSAFSLNMAATLTLNSSAFSPFLPGYTMHPLRMNPPTPIQAYNPQIPKHLFLVSGKYDKIPAVPQYPPRTSSLKLLPQPGQGASYENIPEWQYLPGTTTIFGSSRARRSIGDLNHEGRIRSSDDNAGKTAVQKQVSMVENVASTQETSVQSQAGQADSTHHIKRKPLPPRPGPPPARPLPALPVPSAATSNAANSPEDSLPASMPAPAEAAPPTSTARTLKAKVSQHFKLPSLTNTHGHTTSTLTTTSTSSTTSHNGKPLPVPKQSKLDPASSTSASVTALSLNLFRRQSRRGSI